MIPVMRWLRRWGWRAMVLMAFIGFPLHAGAGPVGRIVSLNLCVDEMVLLLADPADIAGVSILARDCAVSLLCTQARQVPTVPATAEAILARRPQIVLGGTFTATAAVAAVARTGVRVMRFPPAMSLDDFPRQLRAIAHAIGREDRVPAVLNVWERELAAFPDIPPRPDAPGALIYEAHGYVTQKGSFPDALLRRAGLRNAAASFAARADGVVPLERLLAHRPDLLILDRDAQGHSLAQAMLDRDVIGRAFPAPHRLDVPGRLWLCPLPGSLAVLSLLAQARQTLTERGR